MKKFNMIMKTIAWMLIIALSIENAFAYAPSAKDYLRPPSARIGESRQLQAEEPPVIPKPASAGNEENSNDNNSIGLTFEWGIMLSAFISATLPISLLVSRGIAPWYFGLILAVTMTLYAKYSHERGHRSFKWDVKKDPRLQSLRAKAGMLVSGKRSFRFFVSTIIMLVLGASHLLPSILTLFLFYGAAIPGTGAIVEFVYFFGSAWAGKDGLLAEDLLSDKEEINIIEKLRDHHKEDGEISHAIDEATSTEGDREILEDRLLSGEPIWIHEMALVYKAAEERFEYDVEKVRPEFHSTALTVEAPPHLMSQYSYIDCDSKLAKLHFQDQEQGWKRLPERVKGEKRFYVYHMVEKEDNAQETVREVIGIITKAKVSARWKDKSRKGTLVKVYSKDGEHLGIPLRLTKILGPKDKRVIARKENANKFTIDELYDYEDVDEDDGYIMLKRENRTWFPAAPSKVKAFWDIMKKDRTFRWFVIPNLFSVSMGGILAAVMLKEIYLMAQGFGVLALALLGIEILNRLVFIIGEWIAGKRSANMERSLSRKSILKARGAGIGSKADQEVNVKLRRWYGIWWVISTLVQRCLFFILYPFVFKYLIGGLPLSIQCAVFVSIYLIWQMLFQISLPPEARNAYLVGEWGAGRGYAQDIRKEGLKDRFWRAWAFRVNMNSLVRVTSFLITLGIMNLYSITLIQSWYFWGVFMFIAVLSRPLSRTLILFYGEPADSKLIIRSDEDFKPDPHQTGESTYEQRFRFDDLGLSIKAKDPLFAPERIPDYKLSNLYGMIFRLAEIFDQIPLLRRFDLTSKVQRSRFRVEKPYMIVDPDRIGLSLEFDAELDPDDLKKYEYLFFRGVRGRWSIFHNNKKAVEIRLYKSHEHISLDHDRNVIHISSTAAELDDTLHKKNVSEFVDDKLIPMGLQFLSSQAERDSAVETLLRGGVLYIGPFNYSYNRVTGKMESDWHEYKKEWEGQKVRFLGSPPPGLRRYHFSKIEGTDDWYKVYHHEHIGESFEEGHTGGAEVLDGEMRVNYYKKKLPGRIRTSGVLQIYMVSGDPKPLPIERLISEFNPDYILIEKGLTAPGIEESLPGFKRGIDVDFTNSLTDDKDREFERFETERRSLLDYILKWRGAQRADNQESRNLNLGEWGHVIGSLCKGIALPTVILTFSKMGSGYGQLHNVVFYKVAIMLVIGILLFAGTSEMVDKITSAQGSQSARKEAKGDLGIDRKMEAFNKLKKGMKLVGWASFIFALLLVFQIQPVFLWIAPQLPIKAATLFLAMKLIIDGIYMIWMYLMTRVWWKLLEDLVRNNPKLARKGYKSWFFEYLATGSSLNIGFTIFTGVLFFALYPLGITSVYFGATPLGCALSVIAIVGIAISYFIFPLYARFGGDSKLVIESDDEDFIIEKEQWQENGNSNGNGNKKKLVRRWFRFSNGLLVSTKDPKCFPMFSSTESDKRDKRFVVLDPDKYDVKVEYDYEGEKDRRIYDYDRDPIARLLAPIPKSGRKQKHFVASDTDKHPIDRLLLKVLTPARRLRKAKRFTTKVEHRLYPSHPMYKRKGKPPQLPYDPFDNMVVVADDIAKLLAIGNGDALRGGGVKSSSAGRILLLPSFKKPSLQRVLRQAVEDLSSRDSEKQARAVHAIAGIRPKKVPRKLSDMLEDLPHELQVAAAGAMSRGNPNSIHPKLIQLLSDVDPAVQASAAKEISNIRPKDIPPQLVQLLRNPNQVVKFAAAETICDIKPRGILDDVLELFEDPDPFTWVAAAKVVASLHSGYLPPKLIELLKSPKPYLQLIAIEAIGRIRPKDLPIELKELLGSANSDLRASSAEAIGRIIPEETPPELIQLLADPRAKVRAKAAYAVGNIRLENALPKLLELLEDSNSGVRIAAAKAIGNIRYATNTLHTRSIM
ncbi:HEAT repeat domain-containing protein, partial [Candidatus Omnitrophota bacterium]